MTDDVFDLLVSLITTNMKSTKDFHVGSYEIVPEKPSFNLVPKMNDVYLTYRDPHVFEVDVIGMISSNEFYKKTKAIPDDKPYFSYEQEESLIRVLEMNNL